MMSKCEEHTKHRAAAYMKYVRTRASTASPQLPSGASFERGLLKIAAQKFVINQ
ncbi:hypothetical protein [Candidatus Sarmatiella mevalonica]|uniref:hypothetical protein n=1 Tax=Candidatus Sarmatiella mevalonica TaxID=2770581 RepID=UPI001FC89D53|nr:hypothetical protein [Candidatus Sarmatiella mevalonica]